jgi:glutathione S-transferase
VIGLALAACEKTVQAVYEQNLRPAEKLHQPWLDRVVRQLATAYDLIEKELGPADSWLFADRPLQPDVTVAVAWRFTQFALVGAVSSDQYPRIKSLSERAERLPEFVSTPLD